MDLRGHGLSDAPTEDGRYDLDVLAGDAVAVAEGAGLLGDSEADRIVLAGHGFGAIVAARAAADLGDRMRRSGPRGRRLGDARGHDRRRRRRVPARPRRTARGDALARGLPGGPRRRSTRGPGTPIRNMRRRRRSWRPTPVGSSRRRDRMPPRPASGRCSPTTRVRPSPPSAHRSSALIADGDESGSRVRQLAEASATRVASGREPIAISSFAHDGHNLMRYRPREVAAAILSVAG